MIFILTWLKVAFGWLKAIPVRVLAEAVAAIAIWVLWHQLGTAQANLGKVNLQLKAALDANDAAQATITVQGKALAGWKDLAGQAAAQAAQAADQAQKDRAALAAARAKRDKELATDETRPDCARLLATDLAGVCPAAAGWLRAQGRL